MLVKVPVDGLYGFKLDMSMRVQSMHLHPPPGIRGKVNKESYMLAAGSEHIAA